jgi:hypothetical protein
MCAVAQKFPRPSKTIKYTLNNPKVTLMRIDELNLVSRIGIAVILILALTLFFWLLAQAL